ncbi:hypothetical protein NL676_039258 [Syzygium grande]|nr:hypothetical protein NL676_039258 [Syzygium grande]
MDFASTTENAMANCATVLRQPQGDLTRAKSSYIVCEECAEESERGDGPSAFHCCPCDSVVVSFRTKAGPISRPSASHRGPSHQVTVGLRTEAGPIARSLSKKSNPSPSAAEKSGRTSWDWSCLCVHACLGMPTCGCYYSSRNSVMCIKKPY